MDSFTKLVGVVVPIDQANVDTDAIIPKQFLKSIKKSGFGPNLFDEWRYLDSGEPGVDCSARPLNTDFVLNQDRYKNSQVLLARDNFGCGSSREHAPWALTDFGIRCVIAPSFGDIFSANCFKNGLLPVVLGEADVAELFEQVLVQPGYQLDIDLQAQTVTRPDGKVMRFDVDEFRKGCMLQGLDEIGLTLQQRREVTNYEQRRRTEAPWLFAEESA
ncbi:MAG: 3-isopropylmalate/(R)-2-methylmalate dehydratase small subunit [Gammaproteobacteria bacterium]|jgi:3-isopropylmalate/(R)-2-methylmalate dehydratase small subunit